MSSSDTHDDSSPGIRLAAASDDLCGECPVWDPALNCLYWTDCLGLKFQRLDWATGRYDTVKTGVEVYGFRRNQPDGFVVTNTTGVWLWDGRDELVLVADKVEGARLQLNDCTADSAGRLITGSYFYDPDREYELGKLVRIDCDGTAAVLDEGFHLSNGIGLSPDERTLYFSDSVGRRIYAYDYDVRSGSALRRKIFVQVPSTEGVPDGLAVDAAGFVWSAQWYRGCVLRYDPEGKLERTILVPAKQTSSVAFGGPDLSELFITTAAKPEPGPVMPPGYDASSGPFGGPLYRVRPGVCGLEQRMAKIRVPA